MESNKDGDYYKKLKPVSGKTLSLTTDNRKLKTLVSQEAP
jgi:hypothetical protein